MRNFWAIIIGSVICAGATLGGMVYFARHTTLLTETVRGMNPEDFKLGTQRILADLQNRSVVLPPANQIWGFAPDQKVSVEVLQVRGVEDGVVVAVRLTADAMIPATSTPAGPTTATAGAVGNSAPVSTPPGPVNVTLSGVAKLSYEMIAGEWYLTDVTSVNLRATQK